MKLETVFERVATLRAVIMFTPLKRMSDDKLGWGCEIVLNGRHVSGVAESPAEAAAIALGTIERRGMKVTALRNRRTRNDRADT